MVYIHMILFFYAFSVYVCVRERHRDRNRETNRSVNSQGTEIMYKNYFYLLNISFWYSHIVRTFLLLSYFLNNEGLEKYKP